MDNQETQAILGTRHRTKTSKPVVNPRVREGQAVPVCYMTPKCVTHIVKSNKVFSVIEERN